MNVERFALVQFGRKCTDLNDRSAPCQKKNSDVIRTVLHMSQNRNGIGKRPWKRGLLRTPAQAKCNHSALIERFKVNIRLK